MEGWAVGGWVDRKGERREGALGWGVGSGEWGEGRGERGEGREGASVMVGRGGVCVGLVRCS